MREFETAAAECVVRSAGSVSLHEMRESPDADLLHEGGFHVGLEVVRTVDQQYLDAKKRLEAATEHVCRELNRRGVLGRFSIFFELADVASEPSVRHRQLPGQLADLFEASTQDNFEKPLVEAHGVRRVARVERVQAADTVVYCGWRTRGSGATLAAICLEKKHERLGHYRAQNRDQFREYWLAIASLGPGTIEDGGYSMLLERRYVTEYDRVFLLLRGPDGRLAGAQDVTPDVTVSSAAASRPSPA